MDSQTFAESTTTRHCLERLSEANTTQTTTSSCLQLKRNNKQKQNCLEPSLITIMLVLATLLTLLTLPTPSTANSDWIQACSICHCHWNSGKKTADCKAKQLTTIPNDLSSDMQVIDLSYNQIPELRKEEFMEANLQNLHKIFLRNCTIQELNRDALKGLAILIELDLSHNFIKELHVGTFEGLAKLRNLVMNNNQIEYLDNYMFAGLRFLSRVEFKNNKLKKIDIHAFGELPVLSAVYLESNELTVLKKETFQRTPKLVHLSLASNLWNCTCELQEFRDFAISNRLYTPPTDCYEPKHLRGKLWSEVPSENFACKPKILGSRTQYVEAQTDNITLPCRIEGSPRPNVTWLYNKRPINANDPRFKILNSVEPHRADSSNALNSELRIFNVRTSDKGYYTCIADNRGGRAEAEFQLLINGDYIGALGSGSGSGGVHSINGLSGTSASDSASNFLLIICLIVTTLLLLLIIVVLVICWYCRRIKTYQKDSTMLSENGLISSKLDKAHNGSMLEGSVIMEMQKSLLTEVNPVEKPPRRTELEICDGLVGGGNGIGIGGMGMGGVHDDGHEIKKTLLDETPFGK